MRYLLIDRIQRLEFNKQVQAIKNVALSEDVFSDHFFGFPVMPGALLIEALAQAGTVLLEVSSNFEKKAILVMVDEAKFRTLVRPGDQLSVVGTVLSSDGDFVQMDGAVSVAEHRVMTARLTFAVKDIENFYHAKIIESVKLSYGVWLRDAQFVGFPEGRGRGDV